MLSFPRFATQVYPKPCQKAITKTTKEPRTKQAIPPTETAAQYKERSPPWPFDLNYQGGLLSLFFLCSEVRITPHHENGLLHLHLVWCSILSSETAETLAAARVSGVASFSATLVGGPEEIRTLDLSDANRTLSQLSYRPKL